ncbi:class I glutamine amidotransferase-like protein [Gautieria morchelliformis]|nr:class I glutamine amidotransferase-like protein [Gautieria morchelliformis]
MARRLLLFMALVSLLAILSQSQTTLGIPKVLIFSRTVDFRHDSIPTAINAFRQQSSSHNIQFDNTEDQTLFTDSYLSQYDAIIFLSNTGQVLDDPGIVAFQNWVNMGGNFIGIHAASDSLRNNTFFEQELGAHFRDHANLQNATVTVLNSSHPSTSMLPQRWAVQDEMYHFKSDPRAVGVVVLLSADPSTFFGSYNQTAPDPQEGSPSPKAWYQEHGAGASASAPGPVGRSWYTSLGHLNETWQDSTFMAHVMGGLTWALASNTTRAFNANAKVGNPSLSNGGNTSPAAATAQTS